MSWPDSSHGLSSYIGMYDLNDFVELAVNLKKKSTLNGYITTAI